MRSVGGWGRWPAPRVLRRASLARSVVVLAIVAGTNLAGWALLAAPSQAAGGGLNVTVSLSPSTITANGTSMSTATATVNGLVSPVPGETVTFTSSDPGETVSPQPAADQGNGTYTATITSSTTPGTATITATDPAALSPSGTATLTQTTGPASKVAVSLSPTSVPADGTSTSTATATVTDAQGHPLRNETVAFSSSDLSEKIQQPATNQGNGTYTATITSSTTPGTPTITATDTSTSARPSGGATLTQTAVAPPPPATTTTTTTVPGPTPPPVTTTTPSPAPPPVPTIRLGPSPTSRPTSTTTLITVPAAPLTNQRVTLIATVTSSSSALSPAGAVSFERAGAVIGRCGRVPVATLLQSATVTCRTSLTAAPSPQPIVAVFTAASGSLVPGSTSATDDLLVARDPTSTALDLSNPTIKVGSPATYTATVAPRHTGPATPSGRVRFLDRGSPIGSCADRALVARRAVAAATCTITYHRAGTHLITARYRGDAHFRGSRSASVRPVSVRRLPARARGTVTSTMRWTFYYTPAYTRVLALLVRHASAGMTVMVRCHGRGCPFARHATAVTTSTSTSRSKTRSTSAPPTVDLVRSFRRHRLHVGAQLSVALTRRHLIGKSYVFTIRAGRAPRVQIRCLAPGATRPGAHC